MELRIVIIWFGSVLTVVFGQRQCEAQRKCVPIATCPEYREYAKTSVRTWPLAVRNEVQTFFCGTERHPTQQIYKVCCKTEPVAKSGRELLDLESCGKNSIDRITSGGMAQVFQFPWMVLIGGSNGDFHCGGSLIAESFVLTAAHCNREKAYFVRVGETDRSTPIDCTNEMDCADPHQDILVDKFVRHPRYSISKHQNDIALIKLKRPAKLNDNVKPICLPVPGKLPKKLPLNITVTGWGLTEDQTEMSNQLRYAHVPIVGQNKCLQALKQLSDVASVDESQVCAGGGSDGADNCSGDSGGPLQYFGHNAYVLHGIAAWGAESCGELNVPGVYTRVWPYLDWIIDNLN